MTDTQPIKDRIDIVQLIQEYVPLKKAGANWKANCPFHSEKSPSFMVHTEKQIWHCFGCAKGGDIFSFIQEMEGLNFVEALKLLADRAGVKITSDYSDGQQSQRNRLIEINTAAAHFFHQFLLRMPAAFVARTYLQERRVTEKTIAEWQIGYVPEQWDLLTQYLLKKGFGIDDLVASGLVISREDEDGGRRRHYDRFRGRVMFPISDVHGTVVGFTGRVLKETEHSGGKYINTPQTMLYDKSRVLYGLHLAKSVIKAKDVVVLVEGQMDVIACHQAGMKNVVAASGTALTVEQIKLLKRYTGNVAMAFDGDSAGEKAGQRGAGLALEEGMQVKIIIIPRAAGKDADECLKNDPKKWFEAVETAVPLLEWYSTVVLRGYNLADAREKNRGVQRVLAEIAHLPSAVERDFWLKRLSESSGTDIPVLREELKKALRSSPKKNMSAIPSTPSVEPAARPHDRVARLEQGFWALMLKFPGLTPKLGAAVKGEYFVGTPFEELYEWWKKYYTSAVSFENDLAAEAGLPASLKNLIETVVLWAEKEYPSWTLKQAENESQFIITNIHQEWVKRQRHELQRRLARAEKEANTIEVNRLLQQLQAL